MTIALLFPRQASAAAPVIKATWATEVNASSFRARGLVDTGGLVAAYRFDYVTLGAYEANIAGGHEGFAGALHMPIANEAKLLKSAPDQEALQRVGGLAAETSYRFRLVVKNADGEDVGPGRTITTQGAGSPFGVAEGRGWELVSPVDKNGGEIAAPGALFGGGDMQAAAQGGLVTYGSSASFAQAAGAPGASQYVSVRNAGGWSTENVTLPSSAEAFGPEPDGVPYRIFSADLGRALVMPAPHSFELMAIAPAPAPLWSLSSPDLRFVGSTDSLSRVAFSTCEALTADATEAYDVEGCDPASPNLYVRDDGGLHLVNVEPGGSVGAPGAWLAAPAGALSTDGSRIYWVDQSGALLVRDSARTLLVDPEGDFQAASADGSIAFFTKENHLYRYSLTGEASVDLTPSGGVLGVLAVSASGAYVYYRDAGGVELWHAGSTIPVAAAADPSNSPPATGTARVSADGTKLAFLSTAPLTGYDPEGATELYRYDADAGSLLCVSCDPFGARPAGPSSIPGALANGSEVQAYKPRAMDASGSRLFFDSEDALVAGDTNGERDVYEWRAQGISGCVEPTGCLGLISSGSGAGEASFVDASGDGGDVFFLADDSLVGADEGGVDLYDARIGGGFPEPASPIPCIGDACQPLPLEPEDPTPGTLFYGSEENPKLLVRRLQKKSRHRARHQRRHHHHRRAGKHRRHRRRGR